MEVALLGASILESGRAATLSGLTTRPQSTAATSLLPAAARPE